MRSKGVMLSTKVKHRKKIDDCRTKVCDSYQNPD
jgi:hypothetical protein